MCERACLCVRACVRAFVRNYREISNPISKYKWMENARQHGHFYYSGKASKKAAGLWRVFKRDLAGNQLAKRKGKNKKLVNRVVVINN